MKAIIAESYGGPEVLQVDEVETPKPNRDQVLVKIRAVSINSWDWDTLTGLPYEYRLSSGLLKPKDSRIHGCDIAGIIEAVGEDIKGFQIGDEVYGDLSEGGWGAFAEYRCVHENELAHMPKAMTFKQAACMAHAGNLATQGLVDVGLLKADQQLLINGGGGGTGTLAIQIAKSLGAHVTAVDHTDKLAFMTSIGADEVVDYTSNDFTQTGKKYDLIFDVKTARSIFDIRRALKPGGRYVTVGGNTLRILQVALLGRLFKHHKMHMVIYKPNKDLAMLSDLFEAGKLTPLIDQCFPLSKTAEAFQYFGQGGFKGKVVVSIPY